MFSASSEARDRNAPTNANQIRLQTSRIRQEHRPIRYQLPARLSFRQGQVADRTARRSAELAVASHVAGDAADDGALDASLGLRRREGGECQQAKRLRRVPIHKHLIDQGFLQYVEQRRKIGKPLFYEPARARGGKGANPQWQKVAERLGEWVHESLKVTDVQPNHGWRHLWREIVRGTRMKPELCDYMWGHEGKSGTGA